MPFPFLRLSCPARNRCRDAADRLSFAASSAAAFLLLLLLCGCAPTYFDPRFPSSQCGPPSPLIADGAFESLQVCFSSDGLKIGALLVKPKGDGPFPAYIHNHGSMRRAAAWWPLWSSPEALDRRLVAAGYVVLRPARRGYLGSEGEASTYWAERIVRRASDVVLGAYEEARDVEAAFEYLSRCSFVDAGRIAIGGHSVGGVVTVIAAGRLPRAAAVVTVNAGFTWRWRGVEEGYPAVSTLWQREAPRVKAPVLVLQAEDDDVVAPRLGRELAEVLGKRSVPVRLKVYRGGHLFTPVDDAVRFLEEHLGKGRTEHGRHADGQGLGTPHFVLGLPP